MENDEKVVRELFGSLIEAINANTQALLALAESNYAMAEEGDINPDLDFRTLDS